MKRTLLAIAALLLVASSAHAQYTGAQGPMMFSNACVGSPNFGGAALCYDTALNTFNYWNGTTFVLLANASGTITSPLILNGTSSGHINISSGATPTAYTLTLKSTVPAQGDLVTYSNGSGQQASIADVATGQVLASGGTATVPAYTASPSITSLTASGTGDEVIQLTQGGHFTSLLGSASLPTVGTGTVTAGGTDTAMEVTGGTSPVTVTFTTAFHAKPICVCNDETAALGACKAVPNSNGQTVVVTTTGTDSFMLVCVGK